MQENRERRNIRVERRIIGGPAPRPRTLQSKSPREYPGVSREHLKLAKLLSSPLLLGPPICDELVALVEHTFTEHEASIAQYLNAVTLKSSREIAKTAHRPEDEVARILEILAFEKHVITAKGRKEKRKYKLMPIMPGIFEMALIGQTLETMSPWHRRFAELFEALYETGYSVGPEGAKRQPSSFLRFLPVSEVSSVHPMALPSDKLEVVLDRYDTFAVGQCQCRMTMKIVGKGCDKPIQNCLSMGKWAKDGIRHNNMMEVSKKEALEIKLEAESHGLVSWIMNVESSESQASCSCCGCCCHAMRSINEFNAPAMTAPPHFLPSFARSKCTYCGKCARTCPMGSLVVDTKQKQAWQLVERCIGCGLCSLACDKEKAIAMEPVPDYRLPPNSWFALIAQSSPTFIQNTVSTYLERFSVTSWWKD